MTTKEQSLEGLIERVKAATGADARLDVDLATLSGWKWNVMEGALGYWTDPDGDQRGIPNYTASIDAAIALVERVLPNFRWGVSGHSLKDGVYADGPHKGKPKYAAGFRAHVTKHSPLRPMSTIADAKTAPLAILAALLHALKETSNDHE